MIEPNTRVRDSGEPEDANGGKDRYGNLTKSVIRNVIIVAIIAVIPLFFSDTPFILNLLVETFVFAGLAGSWNIIAGFGGQMSFGHGVFFAIGAYVSAILYVRFGISPWISLLLGGGLSMVFGLLIAYPSIRLRGPFFSMATLAINEVGKSLALYFKGITGGAVGILIPFSAGLGNMMFSNRIFYVYIAMSYALIIIAISMIIIKSRFGFYLVATREDEHAANMLGIKSRWIKVQGMVISAFLTSIGGSFYAMYIRFVDPTSLFSLPDVGVKFALVGLIGGLGTVWGPMVGAALVIPLSIYLRASLGGTRPGLHLAIFGLVFVLSALFFKNGIVGWFEEKFMNKPRLRDQERGQNK